MKIYHESWAKFQAKCKLLEREKLALTKTKKDLEVEVAHLKEALEAASLASHGSGLTSRSHSCSSLLTMGREVSTAMTKIHCRPQKNFIGYLQVTKSCRSLVFVR